MSQFTFMFLLVILLLISTVLATVFYLQKRRLQKKIDDIRELLAEFDEDDPAEEPKDAEASEEQSSYLR